MARRIIKTDYSPYHTGAKAVLYDDGSYINYDPDGNVVDSTTVDDDTLDRETWSYNQNEYANRYITNANKSTRPDLVTRSNNTSNTSTRTSNRQSVKQNKGNNNNIVTIGTRSFGDAFKQARNAGLDKFRWKGRVYGTRYASEVNNTGTTIKTTPKSNVTTTKSNTTSSSKPTNASSKPTTQQTNVSRTSGTTAKTTYTRDKNGYAVLPEITVTASAKKKTNTNILQRSLQTVRGAVNRLEGSERFPISVPSDLRKTKYSEDFKRDIIMHRRYGIPNTPMYYKGKWYK